MNRKVTSPSLLVAMALLLVFAAAGAVQILSLNSGLSTSSPININAPVARGPGNELSLENEAVLSASRVDGKFASLVNEEAIASASRVDSKFAELLNSYGAAEGSFADMRTRNYGPELAISANEPVNDGGFAELRARNYAPQHVAAAVPQIRPSYHTGADLASDQRVIAKPEAANQIDQVSAIELSEPLTNLDYAALLDRNSDDSLAEMRARNYGPETVIIPSEALAGVNFSEMRDRNFGPAAAVTVKEAPVDGGFAEIRARNYGPEPVLRVSETVDGGFAELRARNYGPEPVLKTSESGSSDPFAELRSREDYVPGGPVGH